MSKFATRLLTLTVYATALVAVPVVSPADAATNDTKHSKKHMKKVHRAPAIQNAKSQNPFPPMAEDPDRKAAGGGY